MIAHDTEAPFSKLETSHASFRIRITLPAMQQSLVLSSDPDLMITRCLMTQLLCTLLLMTSWAPKASMPTGPDQICYESFGTMRSLLFASTLLYIYCDVSDQWAQSAMMLMYLVVRVFFMCMRFPSAPHRLSRSLPETLNLRLNYAFALSAKSLLLAGVHWHR